MAGNTELLDVYTGRFKVLVVDKPGTDRRIKKAIVNVFTMVIDITYAPPLMRAPNWQRLMVVCCICKKVKLKVTFKTFSTLSTIILLSRLF